MRKRNTGQLVILLTTWAPNILWALGLWWCPVCDQVWRELPKEPHHHLA